MSADPEMLAQLLERGVPWPLAIEAVSSTALDRNRRTEEEQEKVLEPPMSLRDSPPPAGP